VTGLEVDGKQADVGTLCSGVCGSALSLTCTVENDSGSVLTDVSVQLLSVDLLASCSPVAALESVAADRPCPHLDKSVVVIGCLMSAFPQVIVLLCFFCFVALYSHV